MVKIYVASMHRASDGALDKLINKMKKKNMFTKRVDDADCIMAVADRTETFDFAIKCFRENKKIIHLMAGELGRFGDEDDVYRSAITLMSDLQLCQNEDAMNRTILLCSAIDKEDDAHVVGNVFLDNLKIDEKKLPEGDYDVVLYNPPTRMERQDIKNEVNQVRYLLTDTPYMWLEPNGDKNSDVVSPYVTTKNLPRPKFLGALKNCRRFISNSSCMWSEAQFLLKPEQIIPIGVRNSNRESKEANMSIKNASDNIIKILEKL